MTDSGNPLYHQGSLLGTIRTSGWPSGASAELQLFRRTPGLLRAAADQSGASTAQTLQQRSSDGFLHFERYCPHLHLRNTDIYASGAALLHHGAGLLTSERRLMTMLRRLYQLRQPGATAVSAVPDGSEANSAMTRLSYPKRRAQHVFHPGFLSIDAGPSILTALPRNAGACKLLLNAVAQTIRRC